MRITISKAQYMVVILQEIQVRYVDVQRDAVFGFFSGKGSRFLASACSITMQIQMERVITEMFRRGAGGDWDLRIGIGIDRGNLLVR